MGVTMRLRANNLLIAVRKLIWITSLRICANKLLILDNHSCDLLARENFICNLRRGKSERASQDFGPRGGLKHRANRMCVHNALAWMKSSPQTPDDRSSRVDRQIARVGEVAFPTALTPDQFAKFWWD
jgi:hypothetical protein